MLLLLSLCTCGIYLAFWYRWFYKDMKALTGSTPTGMSWFIDLCITLLTAGVWGIYVDFQMSKKLYQYEVENNLPQPNDTMTDVLMLGVAAYLTGYVTNFISSAMHQSQMNRIVEKRGSSVF